MNALAKSYRDEPSLKYLEMKWLRTCSLWTSNISYIFGRSISALSTVELTSVAINFLAFLLFRITVENLKDIFKAFKIFIRTQQTLMEIFFKTYPDLHHLQGGMKFATQISPLLNLKCLVSVTVIMQKLNALNVISDSCKTCYRIFQKIVGRCGPVGLFVSKLTTAQGDRGSNPRGVRNYKNL